MKRTKIPPAVVNPPTAAPSAHEYAMPDFLPPFGLMHVYASMRFYAWIGRINVWTVDNRFMYFVILC